MIARLPFFLLFVVLVVPAHSARAADADGLPRMGDSVSVSIRDARDREQRGDNSLGWLTGRDNELVARGPGGFSLSASVAGAFMDAGDELGVPAFLGERGSAQHHISVEVREFWCEDSAQWTQCSAELSGQVTSADAEGERFEIEESTDRGVPELRERLASMLLLEFARAQSELGLGIALPPDPDTVHPILRFGWVDQTDGSRYIGAIGDGEDDICVQGRGGRRNAIPLEEIASVRVVEVPLPGAMRGDRWGVVAFPDQSWVGGRLLPRPGSTRAVLQTAHGARSVTGDAARGLVVGEWTGGDPRCDAVGSALVGSVIGSTRGPDRPQVEQPPEVGGVVYVDRRGNRLDHLPAEVTVVYGLHEGRLGNRRWKRYRLSWAGFADQIGSQSVELRLDDWVQLNHRRKADWTGAMVGGISLAILSGVLSGVMTAAYNNTGDAGFAVAIPLTAGGIGAGSVLAGISGILRVKWGKRADKPDRYHNLLDYLTLDELDAAMLKYEANGGEDR